MGSSKSGIALMKIEIHSETWRTVYDADAEYFQRYTDGHWLTTKVVIKCEDGRRMTVHNPIKSPLPEHVKIIGSA